MKCCTLRPDTFTLNFNVTFSGTDSVKSLATLQQDYLTTVGHNSNFFLNVSPNIDGTIDRVDMEVYAALGGWINRTFHDANNVIAAAPGGQVLGKNMTLDLPLPSAWKGEENEEETEEKDEEEDGEAKTPGEGGERRGGTSGGGGEGRRLRKGLRYISIEEDQHRGQRIWGWELLGLRASNIRTQGGIGSEPRTGGSGGQGSEGGEWSVLVSGQSIGHRRIIDCAALTVNGTTAATTALAGTAAVRAASSPCVGITALRLKVTLTATVEAPTIRSFTAFGEAGGVRV